MTNKESLELFSKVFNVPSAVIASKDRSPQCLLAKIAYCGIMSQIIRQTDITLTIGVSTPSIKKYIAIYNEYLKSDDDFQSKCSIINSKLNYHK